MKRYDVALSFAGENRAYVQSVAEALVNAGIKVFYDDFEKVTLWGKNLYEYLQDVYKNKARYCVMFISEHYARKRWTTHERQSAQARAFAESEEYILPARFDDTEIPGLNPTIGYLDLRKISPLELARIIVLKLQEHELLGEPGQPLSVADLNRLLEQLTVDPNVNADDPLRFKACPKCGSSDLHRKLTWDRTDFVVAHVSCNKCSWKETGFTSDSISQDEYSRRYPGIEHW